MYCLPQLAFRLDNLHKCRHFTLTLRGATSWQYGKKSSRCTRRPLRDNARERTVWYQSELWRSLVMSLSRAGYSFPTEETYSKIISILKLSKRTASDIVPRWVKCSLQKKFKLAVVDGVDMVVDIKTEKPILVRSQVPQVLRKCHDDVQHPGRTTTEQNVAALYAHVPRSVISDYVKTCHVCISRKPILKPPSEYSIVGKGVMHHVALGIADMTSNCDDDVNYIIHMTCVFSEYTWAKPITSTTALEVANFVRSIFYMFGSPRVLQSDFSAEFTGDDFMMMMNEFPNTTLLRSKANSPQTDGLIKGDSRSLEACVRAWIRTHGSNGWSRALPKIVCDINNLCSGVHGKTPFELMFLRQNKEPSTISSEYEDQALEEERETDSEDEPDFEPNVECGSATDLELLCE